MGASDRYCLRWNNHQQNFLTVMDDLFENQTLTDVTLGVEDGRFLKCHKVILATCSSYFRSLFVNVPCKHPIVVLKDVKYTEIKAILDFMYKGEVSVAREEMTALLKVAELLKVKGLIAGDELSSETAIGSPPGAICSTSSSQPGGSVRNSHHYRASSARPHSTSSPFCGSVKSPGDQDGVEATFSIPSWASSQTLPPDDKKSAGSLTNLNPFLVARQSLLYPQCDNACEATTDIRNVSGNSVARHQDIAILRTILHQDRDDGSYRNRSNGSANNESDERRSSIDLSQGPRAQSPYETDASLMDEDERRTRTQSFTEDARSATTSYSSSQKVEGKRYKKYTRNDVWNAIEAVKGGLSANKAAELFNVPSRTLYDKIKKLGIAAAKHGRRSENVRAAGFSYETGNVNSGLSENVSNKTDESNSAMLGNPASIVATTIAENPDEDIDRPLTSDVDRTSASPPICIDNSTLRSIEESTFPDNETEAEDLTVSRRTNVGVLISPNIAIK